ncbi:MAG: hypothetical protein V4719_16395 [Planctomycetota bacterium]
MFRASTSILVIAGLLVSHMLAIPHSHGLESAADQRHHNSAFHFHLRWLSGFGTVQVGLYCESQSEEVSRGDVGREHDADAIYLPGADSPLEHNSRISGARPFSVLTAAITPQGLPTIVATAAPLAAQYYPGETSHIPLRPMILRI